MASCSSRVWTETSTASTRATERRSGASVPAASGDSAPPGIHGIRPSAEVMPIRSMSSYRRRRFGTAPFTSEAAIITYTRSTRRPVRSTGNSRRATSYSLALPVHDGVVYVGSWDRYFYALDARTGALAWKFATGDDRTLQSGGHQRIRGHRERSRLFRLSRQPLLCGRRTHRRLRWKRDQHGSWVIGSPAIAGSSV